MQYMTMGRMKLRCLNFLLNSDLIPFNHLFLKVRDRHFYPSPLQPKTKGWLVFPLKGLLKVETDERWHEPLMKHFLSWSSDENLQAWEHKFLLSVYTCHRQGWVWTTSLEVRGLLLPCQWKSLRPKVSSLGKAWNTASSKHLFLDQKWDIFTKEYPSDLKGARRCHIEFLLALCI